MQFVHVVLELEENEVSVLAVFEDEAMANSVVAEARYFDRDVWYESTEIS